MKIFKGKLSISRRSGDNPSVSITLRDELSGTECVDLQISPENFGNAITGFGFQECEFEFRPDQVGKVREHKTVAVTLTHKQQFANTKDRPAVAK